MSFEADVLEHLVRLVRLSRRPNDMVVVPIRWWPESDAICLVYEVPPGRGLNGLRLRLYDELVGRPRTHEQASGWANDIATSYLWT